MGLMEVLKLLRRSFAKSFDKFFMEGKFVGLKWKKKAEEEVIKL